MFREAVSKRIVSFKDQYEHPLNVDEILGAGISWLLWKNIVQLHYKKIGVSEWQPNPRPYRTEWITLLESAGEFLPQKRDLSPIKVDKVLDMHELNLNTYKPQLNSVKSMASISHKPHKVYSAPYRPEAGLIVNNTENIREAIMDAPNYEQL